MYKKLLFVLIVLSLIVLPSLAQDSDTETLILTESEINDALADMLAARNSDFEMTVSIKGGLVMINFRTGTRPHVDGLTLGITAAPSIDSESGRIQWLAADWSVTDTDGNAIEDFDEANVYEFVDRILDVWGRVFQQVLRMGKSTPILFEQITVNEDSIVIDYQNGDDPLIRSSDNGRPANVTENDDGTLTISITENMINDAFAVIAERNDNLTSFIVEIDGIDAGQFSLQFQTQALCNNEVIEGVFRFSSPSNLMDDSDGSETVQLIDVDGDGDDEVVAIFVPGRTYAILDSPMTCNGEAMTIEQSGRVTGLLLPAVQRFLRLQVRGSIIVDFRVVDGGFEITVEAPNR